MRSRLDAWPQEVAVMIYPAILDATFRCSHASYPVLLAPENVW
jgi:hypothetical protein